MKVETEMPEWLGRRAALTPDRTALIAGDEVWSFSELHARSTHTARRLAGLGIGEGDRIALLLPNGPHFVEMVHALIRLGAVLVPLNLRLNVAELAWQLSDVRPALLVFDSTTSGMASQLHELFPELRSTTVGPDLQGQNEVDAPLRDRVDLSAVHAIVYTSGTTGHPKGAQITYGNHWWSAVGSMLNLNLHEDDRWLACLPLFHVGGLSIVMKSMIYGIPAVVHARFDPGAVNRAIDEDRVTMISVVSNMLSRMLRERGDRSYPDWLRCVLLGGGPAARPLLEACAARNIPVVQTYGLTETNSQAVTLAPGDALRKLGSAGKPLFPNELRIEADGREAAPFERGEILVRGPSVTPGYFENPEATAAALTDDGWLRTGDVGYLDAEGYLYVLDRRSDLIVSGGENVYPAEVEAALLEHPDVLEAGVTGLPDAEWGRVPVAAVRRQYGSDLSEEALRSFCRSRLAGYKVPRRIQFVSELPRNGAGKLLRRSLGELFDVR